MFNSLSVEVEQVRRGHKKVCAVCGTLPTDVRMAVTKGAGRYQTLTVLCSEHAYRFSVLLRDRAEALMAALGASSTHVTDALRQSNIRVDVNDLAE